MPFQSETKDSSHSVVTLASSEKLTEEEVISRVNSYERYAVSAR